jgi:hypothetical protein
VRLRISHARLRCTGGQQPTCPLGTRAVFSGGQAPRRRQFLTGQHAKFDHLGEWGRDFFEGLFFFEENLITFDEPKVLRGHSWTPFDQSLRDDAAYWVSAHFSVVQRAVTRAALVTAFPVALIGASSRSAELKPASDRYMMCFALRAVKCEAELGH